MPMATRKEVEAAALAKHEELMHLPKVGVRLVDHNLTSDLASGKSAGTNQEINVFENQDSSGFRAVVNHFDVSKYGTSTNELYDLTGWSHASDQNEVYRRLLMEYYSRRVTGQKEPKKKTITSEKPFERFRSDTINDEQWRRLIRALPRKLDIKSAKNEIKKLPDDDVPNAMATALLFTYYGPHHAAVLRELHRPNYGSKLGEKEKALRAVAYFSRFDYDGARVLRLISPNVAKSAIALPSSGNVETIKTTPYSYNAAAFIHPTRVSQVDPVQLSYGRWQQVTKGVGHPVQGLMVLEPSINAAKEVAQRLQSHWRKNPRDAFPVYDYRGRLVWPIPKK